MEVCRFRRVVPRNGWSCFLVLGPAWLYVVFGHFCSRIVLDFPAFAPPRFSSRHRGIITSDATTCKLGMVALTDGTGERRVRHSCECRPYRAFVALTTRDRSTFGRCLPAEQLLALLACGGDWRVAQLMVR